jgi:hypothetical protein
MNYRHGDLFYKKVEEFKGEMVFEGKSFRLAEGEATGHHHVLTAPRIKIYDDDGQRYVSLSKTGTLDHPEHGTITIQPGTYIEIREREFDYFSNEMRRVVD